jgi:membrane fusion protein (multidrug efflux system)
MNRKYIWFFASVIYLITHASCGKKAKPQNPAGAPVPVNTYKVIKQPVVGFDNYPGTVVAVNEVELRPQVAGYITAIFVKDGQAVTQGQKLYEIDRSKYQAGYRQAQANVQSAQASLDRARKDLDRYEHLLERDAIARQQVDYARADFKTAQSQVRAAEAQLTSAATDVRYSVITAPFNGNIGISQVRLGSQVSPGQTLLNTISSNDPIAIDFVVSQREIPRFNRLIREGARADSTFSILLSDGSVYPYTGKITTMDRAVNRQTGSINIRLNVPNPERQLIPGMTVNVKVRNQDIGAQVIIPYKAVTEQMGEYFVYVVNADSVNQRKVSLGTRFNEMSVVREGLKEGETIVVEGIQRLRQGAKIQTGAPAGKAGADQVKK